MSWRSGFRLIRSDAMPGDYGEATLELKLVPNRKKATSADGIGAAVTNLIKKEGLNFRGKSVLITIEDLRICRGCGCWEEAACDGGCEWVEPDLCSRCVPEAEFNDDGSRHRGAR